MGLVTVNLIDGSSLRGHRRWRFPWSPLKLEGASYFSPDMPDGPLPVDGVVRVPWPKILWIQEEPRQESSLEPRPPRTPDRELEEPEVD